MLNLRLRDEFLGAEADMFSLFLNRRYRRSFCRSCFAVGLEAKIEATVRGFLIMNIDAVLDWKD